LIGWRRIAARGRDPKGAAADHVFLIPLDWFQLHHRAFPIEEKKNIVF
jgi:hypothetical protein